jgi:YVTN family beta-propeller protein
MPTNGNHLIFKSFEQREGLPCKATTVMEAAPHGREDLSAPFAYVTNESSNNVSVIDTASNTVVGTVTVGITPVGVAVTPDGKQAFVAEEGSKNVSVIATVSNTVVATIQMGGIPHAVAVTPDGTLAYVTSNISNSVGDRHGQQESGGHGHGGG